MDEMESRPVTHHVDRPRRPGWQKQVAWSLGLTVLLILGALYAPLLKEQPSVSAETQLLAPATTGTGAPALQMTASLREDQEALADLYDLVAPSVVNIQVTTRGAQVTLPGFGTPNAEPPVQQSQGSGFIYDNEGHIVTNNHVVENALSVLVVFNNGHWADAEVVATDPQADLAVLKVTPPPGVDWRPLPLDEPDQLRVGHTVVAIGNPFGLAGTMTTGIVSALGRGIPIGDGDVARYTLPDVIQTDAAINPGNSGGPLVNLDGEVVGVNFAIRSQVRSNAGVGFAIPVSIVRRVVPALIEEGRYAYAYLGLSGSSITAQLARQLGLPDNQLGVYVAEVVPNGPSANADIRGGREVVRDDAGREFRRGGDIVIAIDDVPVARFEDLVSYLVTKAAPGQTVTLTLLRDGETVRTQVTLGERPTTSGRASQQPQRGPVNAREAIAIAVRAAEAEGAITAEIEQRVAVPDTLNDADVWVVELTTANETVVVTVAQATGEVLDITVR